MALSEVITNYRTRRPLISAILKSTDQASLEADLKAFFVEGELPYLRHANDLAAQDRLFLRSWHWPFFLSMGFGWAFYRRLYTLGAGLFVAQLVTILMGTNPRMVGLAVILMALYWGALIAMTLYAKSIYVGFALNAIARANDRRIAAHKRGEYLARAGGVSRASGIAGGALLVLNIVLMIALASSAG